MRRLRGPSGLRLRKPSAPARLRKSPGASRASGGRMHKARYRYSLRAAHKPVRRWADDESPGVDIASRRSRAAARVLCRQGACGLRRPERDWRPELPRLLRRSTPNIKDAGTRHRTSRTSTRAPAMTMNDANQHRRRRPITTRSPARRSTTMRASHTPPGDD